MKIPNYLVIGVLALGLMPVFAQQPQPPRPAVPPTRPPAAAFNERLATVVQRAGGDSSSSQELSKFNLDFPGGTPKQLVAAIEEAMGRPINVIISEEYANVKLPPLKLSDVIVPQLFAALTKMSYKYDNNRNVISSYAFETEGGQVSEDSIWRFVAYDSSRSQPSQFVRFDLDFPGGTPKQLVAAIEKATGTPLNAIIPAEHADVKLPPLKMSNVTVPDLFQALEMASMKTEPYVTGGFGDRKVYQQKNTSYGFRMRNGGPVSDDSVWYFYVDGLNMPPLNPTKACRFYSLGPYLERGLSVDDITTAIQTGWKMQGDKPTPQISFHKETKLLIAVGEPDKLETIDAVLNALNPPKPGRASDTTDSPAQRPDSQNEKK